MTNNNERPLILVSNDDGYRAQGLNELIGFLRPIADIVVLAPDIPRSGSGCSITSSLPIKMTRDHQEPGVTRWICSGTPTDCIKLALQVLADQGRRPDMIVSGINHGDNSSVNAHYSGTMGAAIEGALKGIPSIAFSLCDHSPNADFMPLKPYVAAITAKVLRMGLPAGTCLNVNFPKATEFKGIKICRQTRGDWQDEFEAVERKNGERHFWMTGEYRNDEPESTDTDHWALDNGYVAITPTTIDLTAYNLVKMMQGWQFDDTEA